MLKHLLIKNYALIRELEMQPSAHLNIITGETGAGKSIMLGAVGMLLGNRADTRMLYDEETKCVVEGTFDISEYAALKQVFGEEELEYDAETVIRREISPSGKSRAFINDTPVTLEVLRRVGEYLMDVHSQHDTLQLGTNAYQLSILDAYAQTTAELERYQQAYRGMRRLQQALDRLQDEAASMRKEADYNAYLLQELEEARLDGLDQQEQEEELEKLEHAEEIKVKLAGVLQALEYGDELALNPQLHSVLAELRAVGKYAESYRQLAQRLESVVIELKDITREVEAEEGAVELDQERIVTLQDRLSALYKLQQKHGVQSVQELLQLRNELSGKVNRAEGLDEEIAAIQQQLQEARQQVEETGTALSKKRKGVFEKLVKQIEELLGGLGMPEARLQIDHKAIAPAPTGLDEVNLLFTANKGMKPQPLKAVASGGEFSRLMFCVKYVLADKTALPTIVFDEIDTGISGEIALKMVRMMQQMARGHQVISISHLPQIAAKGEAHYFVYKDNSTAKTFSRIKKLTEEERVQEIAKMIGGATPSAVAFESARELMAG
ncbi:DNA repair protein RecN [Cesiribacter andamanensis]|uniref:DNA repair protein RecN n=1 Tax=Cesiribacter andamanensis AMV16 TaxID=1279009 RepID=M7NY00_9BACT|nr:DNA repair protein RecN [Cesiribacter andamanensis]EMR03239.1 Recombination protein N [Cesiribacter andamanensis AMV16]